MNNKTSKILFLLVTCGLFVTRLHAQENPREKTIKKAISIDIGYSNTVMKDITYSPLNYKGSSISLALGYEKENNGGKYYVAADFSSQVISSVASSTFDTDLLFGNIELGYLKRLKTSSEQIELFVGAQAHTMANVLFFDNEESFGFFVLHSLDLSAEIQYALSQKHQLRTGLNVPIFGFLTRPPYTTIDLFISENDGDPVKILSRGNWTSLNDFFAINWKLSYRYQLSDKWNLKVENNLRYYKTSQLSKAIILNNQLSFGLTYNF